MKVFSKIAAAPKRAMIALFAFFALVALPINSVMAADVTIEGSIGVANQTKGETTYKPSTNAKYDEVVKFSVYYHNRQLPDSNKVAEDLKIKVDMPTAAGTSQVVKVTIKGSNTNTVTDTATVNLDRADARLEFIPGSVYWTHNTGTRENIQKTSEKINDSIILNGTVLEDVKPCHEFEATVSFMARVKIPSVSITKKVRAAGTNDAAAVNLSAQPNARLEYLITVKNLGNDTLSNVMVRDALPAGLTFVPGTVKLFNGPNPSGVTINNDYLFKGGVSAGSMGPGATVYFTFIATTPTADKLACGANAFKNVAVVDTDQTGEYNNNSIVTVNKECANVPTYKCDSLTIAKKAGRQITVDSLKYTVTGGATFKNVSYDWGDGTTPMVTDKVTGVDHTYAKDGEYNVVATVNFTVNGQVKSATCTAKVIYQNGTPVTPTTPETPTVLPNTGVGSVIGLFAAISVAGAIAHRIVLARR